MITSFEGWFPVHLKEKLRPVHALLTLDSGEQLHRQLTGEGHSQYGNQPLTGYLKVVFSVQDTAFLQGLSRAKMIAADFKYADGEMLAHEQYNIARPTEPMNQSFSSAIEKSKDLPARCPYILERVET